MVEQMSTEEHKKEAPEKVTIGIITVSTTRALENDKSGIWIHDQATALGHDIVYQCNRPVAPILVRNDLGEDAVDEDVPDDFIAAGRRFPCPVRVLCGLPA